MEREYGQKLLTKASKYIKHGTCRCSLCASCSMHNVKVEAYMSEQEEVVTNNKENTNTVAYRALGRLNAVKLFFKACLKHLGLFVLGMFIGMGIVLKNPPVSSEVSSKIKNLEEEKAELEKSRSGVLVFKNSIELPQ